MYTLSPITCSISLGEVSARKNSFKRISDLLAAFSALRVYALSGRNLTMALVVLVLSSVTSITAAVSMVAYCVDPFILLLTLFDKSTYRSGYFSRILTGAVITLIRSHWKHRNCMFSATVVQVTYRLTESKLTAVGTLSEGRYMINHHHQWL